MQKLRGIIIKGDRKGELPGLHPEKVRERETNQRSRRTAREDGTIVIKEKPSNIHIIPVMHHITDGGMKRKPLLDEYEKVEQKKIRFQSLL